MFVQDVGVFLYNYVCLHRMWACSSIAMCVCTGCGRVPLYLCVFVQDVGVFLYSYVCLYRMWACSSIAMCVCAGCGCVPL